MQMKRRTLSVESRSSKRTKPKPFDRPDLSHLTVAFSTVPNWAKYSQRCSKTQSKEKDEPEEHSRLLPIFVSGLKPPTKTFRVLKEKKKSEGIFRRDRGKDDYLIESFVALSTPLLFWRRCIGGPLLVALPLYEP